MPTFATADEVHEKLGPLLRGAVADAEVGPALHAVDTVFQLRLTSPETLVTLGLRAGQEPAVVLGSTDLEAETVLLLEADRADELLAGRLAFTLALAQGTVLAKGPVRKLLELLRHLHGLGSRVAPVEAEAPVADEPAAGEPAAGEPAADAPEAPAAEEAPAEAEPQASGTP